MSERYLIEEDGNPEDGYSWNIMLNDGRLRCIAQCLDEQYAEQIVSALKWVDALGSGMMKLAMDGIAIDANSGRVWKRPANLKQYDIKTEKKPARKPRT